jgi:cell volume regulation protein A
MLDDSELAGTTSELLCKRLGRPPVVGDRVRIGSIELTVRAMEGRRVSSVGLKLSQDR